MIKFNTINANILKKMQLTHEININFGIFIFKY